MPSQKFSYDYYFLQLLLLRLSCVRISKIIALQIINSADIK